MSELPPRQRLARVLRSLNQHLPGQLEGLLDNSRFVEGAAALRRLGDSAHLEAALARMSPEEAGWLAGVIEERWGWVAEVRLDPEVAIVAPEEVWIGAEPVRVPLALASVGLDPGFEAVWEGAVVPGPPSPKAILVANPPSGSEPAVAKVRAHVRASAGGKRCILVAQAQVQVRRPAVLVSDDRRRFIVKDQADRPAVGIRLEIGDAAHTTGPGGLVQLEEPAAPGSALRVQGVPAGRVPDSRA